MTVNNMEYHNILIIKMSSLGDVLHTLPFVGASAIRRLCAGSAHGGRGAVF